MKSFFTPFKVGLLILAAIAALVFMLGKMSQSAVKKGRGYTVYAILDDATGLKEQSRVMMAGIPVGEVSKISLSGTRARVDLRISRDLTLREGKERTGDNGRVVFLNGATLTKRQASLLGDYFLELSPGLDGKELAEGDRIQNTILPANTDDLIQEMNDLAG